MTGVTPGIARAREAREEFNDATRDMGGELIRNIQQGTVPDLDRTSPLVQKAIAIWKRCQTPVQIDDPTVDWTTRMA